MCVQITQLKEAEGAVDEDVAQEIATLRSASLCAQTNVLSELMYHGCI